jgi:hypothetical protein
MSNLVLEREHGTCSTSSRSQYLDSLFFPVEISSLPSKSLFPGLTFAAPLAQVVYLPFQEKVVNFAGGNYKLTTNEEFFTPIFDELVKTFGSSQLAVTALNEDDSRFAVDFVINNKEIQVAQKDVLKLMVRARNSYDGTQRASIEFLALRQICSNGLCAWSTYDAPGINKNVLKHNTNTAQLVQGLGTSLEALTISVDKFKSFTDRIVTGAEMDLVIQTLQDNKGISSFPKRIIPEVPEKIAQEMKALGTQDLSAWLLYNGFNYFLSHDPRINLKDNIKSQIDHHVKDTISSLLHISHLN